MEGYKKDKRNRKCGFCQYDHRVEQCSNFKIENVDSASMTTEYSSVVTSKKNV